MFLQDARLTGPVQQGPPAKQNHRRPSSSSLDSRQSTREQADEKKHTRASHTSRKNVRRLSDDLMIDDVLLCFFETGVVLLPLKGI